MKARGEARRSLALVLSAAASFAAASFVCAPRSAHAEIAPLVDRVAVIFDAPETGGAAAPRTILERELAFEARLEALASNESLGDERGAYAARHVRAALDRHIATELLAALPDEIVPRPTDPCDHGASSTDDGVPLARALLIARVKGEEPLRAAMERERVTDDDLVRLLRREARAARYLDRVVAPMLAPTDGELRILLRTPSHPLADKPFPESRCALRHALVSQRLGLALSSFLQTSRLRVHVRNLLPLDEERADPMRTRAVLALAVVTAVCTLAPAREIAAPPSTTASPRRVGLVFDVGGRGDKSFNDAAYTGLLAASKTHGAAFELAEPSGAEDREAALRLLAARRFDLVIGVGHIFSRDMTEVAKEFPGVRFACVDFSPDGPLPPNLTGLGFREQEGAFLVGAAAALTSRTKHLGFVGGMSISLIRKFEAGYRAGVREVCPRCETHVAYAGTTPDAFRDPAKGKALAATQIANGVDVLFHAAGATGHGVFEAARESKTLAIGVDRDQFDEMPDVMLTSLVKRVDTAVATVVSRVIEDRFPGGEMAILGLKENGVSWVHEGPHAQKLSAETVRRVEELRQRIEAGEINVPTTP